MCMNDDKLEFVVDIQLMKPNQLVKMPTMENLLIDNVIYFKNIEILKKFLEKPLIAHLNNNYNCFFKIDYEMKKKFPAMILPTLELKKKIDQGIVVDEDFTVYQYYVICGSDDKNIILPIL